MDESLLGFVSSENNAKRISMACNQRSISDLPEIILHQIMSFLPAKDLSKLPVLSKQFNSLWKSFPVIDFDQKQTSLPFNMFLDHVKFSIQLRQLTTVLQKFSLKFDPLASSSLATSNPLFDDIICFALENKVQYMDITSYIDTATGFKLMNDFESKSLVVLKLTRIDFDIALLISSCPSLQNLILDSCSVSEYQYSNEKTTNQSLTKLSLTCVNITDKCIEECVSKSVNLKILKVEYSTNLRNLRIISEKLEILEVVDTSSMKLNSIQVVAPNLRSLHFSSNKCVTGDWVKAQVYRLPLLENLKLQGCTMLGRIEICNDRLESLEVIDCKNVGEVSIDATNLRSFVYRGEFTTFSLMACPLLCNPILKLEYREIAEIHEWYPLRNLLSFFSHCKTLTLECCSSKDYIIPKDVRASREVTPLYNVKHLKVKIDGRRKIDSELFDNLLWLCPRLESLCIVRYSDEEKIIKFYYDETSETEQHFCSSGWPLKYWRDDLIWVELQNFESTDDDQDHLLTYFDEYAQILETCPLPTFMGGERQSVGERIKKRKRNDF